MANKKKQTKKATKKAAVIDDSAKTSRPGGRVPTDDERKEKGQIRRTLRVSDPATARKFERAEELHGGTAGAVTALVEAYEAHVSPLS